MYTSVYKEDVQFVPRTQDRSALSVVLDFTTPKEPIASKSITRVDLVLQELLVLIIFEWSDIYISYTMIYTCVNKDFCMLLFFIPNT